MCYKTKTKSKLLFNTKKILVSNRNDICPAIFYSLHAIKVFTYWSELAESLSSEGLLYKKKILKRFGHLGILHLVVSLGGTLTALVVL